jgi:serine/threonine protein kinase
LLCVLVPCWNPNIIEPKLTRSCSGAAQARKNAVGERVKDLMIQWSDITLLSEIGSGGFGTVYRGTWQDIEVAVKKLHISVITERAKMSLLRHPNVAVSYGMVLEPRNCALVMKYYQRGTLLELLHDDTQPLPLTRKLQVRA